MASKERKALGELRGIIRWEGYRIGWIIIFLLSATFCFHFLLDAILYFYLGASAIMQIIDIPRRDRHYLLPLDAIFSVKSQSPSIPLRKSIGLQARRILS